MTLSGGHPNFLHAAPYHRQCLAVLWVRAELHSGQFLTDL